MYGGEIGDKGEESLEDLELYVDALGHAVVHCLDDGRDGRERDGAQGDKALERAEGNRDHLYVFGCTTHEDRAKEVICMPAICRDNVRRSSPGFKIEAHCMRCDATQKRETYPKRDWQLPVPEKIAAEKETFPRPIQQRPISGVHRATIYTTHLAHFRVLPPRLGSQGLGRVK